MKTISSIRSSNIINLCIIWVPLTLKQCWGKINFMDRSLSSILEKPYNELTQTKSWQNHIRLAIRAYVILTDILNIQETVDVVNVKYNFMS